MSVIEYVAVERPEELAELAGLFATVFGTPLGDVVTMRESLLCGGFCAVAREDDSVVGGTWGMIGNDASGLFDHAMAAAVLPSHQNRGIVREIQRLHIEWCLAHEISRIKWTFDPMMPQRAHITLNVFNDEFPGYPIVGDGYLRNCFGQLDGVLGYGDSAPSDRMHVTRYLGGWSPPEEAKEVLVPIPPIDESTSTSSAQAQLRAALEPIFERGGYAVNVERPKDRPAYRLLVPRENGP